MRIYSLFISLFLLISCQSNLEYPGLTDENATVILLSQEGKLIDFVHITPDSGIRKIEFMAPESGDEIIALAVGPNLHESFPDNVYVFTRKGEGYRGKITVVVKEGIVNSMMGNGVGYGLVLTQAHLEQVGEMMKDTNRQHPETTVILRGN
jgi:hypothetical protein